MLAECGVGPHGGEGLGLLWKRPVESPKRTGVRFFHAAHVRLRALSHLPSPFSSPSPRSMGLALGLGLTSPSLLRARVSTFTPR